MITNNSGWIIAQRYRHNNSNRYKPIGIVQNDGSHSGNIYVYPTRKCAESNLEKVNKRFKNMCILKVDVSVTKACEIK